MGKWPRRRAARSGVAVSAGGEAKPGSQRGWWPQGAVPSPGTGACAVLALLRVISFTPHRHGHVAAVAPTPRVQKRVPGGQATALRSQGAQRRSQDLNPGVWPPAPSSSLCALLSTRLRNVAGRGTGAEGVAVPSGLARGARKRWFPWPVTVSRPDGVSLGTPVECGVRAQPSVRERGTHRDSGAWSRKTAPRGPRVARRAPALTSPRSRDRTLRGALRLWVCGQAGFPAYNGTFQVTLGATLTVDRAPAGGTQEAALQEGHLSALDPPLFLLSPV